MDFEVMGPYVIAFMMSMGALCVFIWGVLSGAFTNVNDAAINFYRAEVGDDGARERPAPSRS